MMSYYDDRADHPAGWEWQAMLEEQARLTANCPTMGDKHSSSQSADQPCQPTKNFWEE